jgi:hypothetical protein
MINSWSTYDDPGGKDWLLFSTSGNALFLIRSAFWYISATICTIFPLDRACYITHIFLLLDMYESSYRLAAALRRVPSYEYSTRVKYSYSQSTKFWFKRIHQA